MNRSQSEIQSLLQASFAEQPLSRADRQDLESAIRGAPPAELSLWRSVAFGIARDHPHTPTASLEWLEGVMKAIHHAQSDESRPDRQPSSACFSPGTSCLDTINRRLDQAGQTADLCVFTITDDRITRAILTAHQRGIAFRIVTDDDKALDLGSDIERLREAGLAVRTDRTPAHMHHKFAIFDRKWLLNGSYNWTRGAAADNLENIVVSTEKALIDAFQSEFEALWERLA
jgi:mitochondrial cardiolipin hydrolase